MLDSTFDPALIARVRSVRASPGAAPSKGTPAGCLARKELARLPHSVPALAAAVDALLPPVTNFAAFH